MRSITGETDTADLVDVIIVGVFLVILTKEKLVRDCFDKMGCVSLY